LTKSKAVGISIPPRVAMEIGGGPADRLGE
jgi:hypothetical protein